MPYGVKYAPDVKAHAMLLAREVGSPEAERRTGVDETTIQQWLRDDARGDTSANVHPSIQEANRQRWLAWRESTADRMATIVDKGITLAERAAEEGKGRDYKDAVLGASIAIDKVQLLTGAASSHHVQTINHVIDVGYQEQMNVIGRVIDVRARAIEASSTEMPIDVPSDDTTIVESHVVTDE